ncbi:hypothetical protein [Bordetella petrii]|uniref:hypothetical protein n=1 Tax=Bordetella petrii TaxID=94624 RepID=UPI001A96B6B1|nr:hypothetical protein [Bordetella petrii]MBO1111550.1 hypothetical protein [Bordetella petrii]
MRNGTPRQNYLYLLARLSELASEFSQDQLESALKLRNDGKSAVGRAIRALVDLHDELPQQTGHVHVPTPPSAHGQQGEGSHAGLVATQSSPNGSAMQRLLLDESLFPKLSDIATLAPPDIQPRDKESRVRFAKRLASYYDGSDPETKTEFRERLRRTAKNSGGFVGRWSTAIKDL